MTILKVTVEDAQADELKRLLHDIAIVKSVEEEQTGVLIGSAQRIKEILESAKGKDLFSDIEDPVEWQRNIRKEWDRDF
jgi:Xaa-Pro aminopeptidase